MWRLCWFLFSNIHYAIVIDEIKAIITSKTRKTKRLRRRFVAEFEVQHYYTSQSAQSSIYHIIIFGWERTQVYGKYERTETLRVEIPAIFLVCIKNVLRRVALLEVKQALESTTKRLHPFV